MESSSPESKLYTKCNAIDEQKVGLAHFTSLRVLGVGAYGKVYLVRKNGGNDDRQLYAMKVIRKDKATRDKTTIEHTRSERQVLEDIQKAPFLVSLHYAFQTDSRLYLVLEYASGGDLFTNLGKQGQFSQETVKVYIAELVLAIEHLHKMGIIYRDIKLENILLDSEGHILLTDFDLSKRFSSHPEHRAYTVCGTPEYIAPEIIRGGGYGYAVDWWSIGALTCELLTNTSPFPAEEENNSPSDILRRIDEMDPVLPSTLDETTRDFLLKMLNKDPEKRLSEHVKKHAFFYGIDWTDLKNKKQEAPFKPILHDGDDSQNFSEEFTNQPLLDSPAEVLHNANSLFRGYSYVAPQHLCGRLATKRLATFPVAYLNKPISDPPSAPETLFLGRLISSGSSGTCCTTIYNNQTYAVKIIPDTKYRPSEVDALISCAHDDHKSIAQYVATYRNGSDIWIVQEYVPGDEVAERITNREYNFDEVKCRAIFKQLIDAVKHIHEKRFIHGDLKLENIIFTDDETDQIKLVDFGAASYTSNRSMWNDVPRYTIDYAPPEALQHAEYATYSASFDIWCLGAILYSMFMGHTPFRRERAERYVDAATLKQRILHGEIFTCADRWNEASSELRNLIGSCLEKDITKRATMQEILLHPWLKINARQAYFNLSRAFDIDEDFLGYENSKNKRARKRFKDKSRLYKLLLYYTQNSLRHFKIE